MSDEKQPTNINIRGPRSYIKSALLSDFQEFAASFKKLDMRLSELESLVQTLSNHAALQQSDQVAATHQISTSVIELGALVRTRSDEVARQQSEHMAATNQISASVMELGAFVRTRSDEAAGQQSEQMAATNLNINLIEARVSKLEAILLTMSDTAAQRAADQLALSKQILDVAGSISNTTTALVQSKGDDEIKLSEAFSNIQNQINSLRSGQEAIMNSQKETVVSLASTLLAQQEQAKELILKINHDAAHQISAENSQLLSDFRASNERGLKEIYESVSNLKGAEVNLDAVAQQKLGEILRLVSATNAGIESIARITGATEEGIMSERIAQIERAFVSGMSSLGKRVGELTEVIVLQHELLQETFSKS